MLRPSEQPHIDVLAGHMPIYHTGYDNGWDGNTPRHFSYDACCRAQCRTVDVWARVICHYHRNDEVHARICCLQEI